MTLKRGFLASRIDEISNRLRLSNLSELFRIEKEQKMHEKLGTALQKVYLRKNKEVLLTLMEKSEATKAVGQHFVSMIGQYHKRATLQGIKSIARTMSQKRRDI